jgi:hypothetical protein
VPVKRHIVCGEKYFIEIMWCSFWFCSGAKAVKFTSAHMLLHVFNAAHDRQSLRPHFSCHLSQQSGTIEIGVHSARSGLCNTFCVWNRKYWYFFQKNFRTKTAEDWNCIRRQLHHEPQNSYLWIKSADRHVNFQMVHFFHY